MKKISKGISILLVAVLVIAMATITTFAADAVSITVITPPDKTVYYEGLDDYDTDIWCNPIGMVLEIAFDDGTTEQVTVDEDSYVDMEIENYVIGDNEAVVTYYGTDDYDVELTTTCTVTVLENPIESIEITKMPTKTEYDIEKDVLTRDNFSIDDLYEEDPEMMDELLGSLGMTFEDLKEFYEENPQMFEMILDLMFDEDGEILLVDTEGMEILITYKDGTTQTVSVDDGYVEFNGELYPIFIEQAESEVSLGENVMILSVMGQEKEFVVNVVGAPEEEPNENNNNNNDNNTPIVTPNKDVTKDPEIPNTDGSVSVAPLAVFAIVSAFGIAVIPSKKRK